MRIQITILNHMLIQQMQAIRADDPFKEDLDVIAFSSAEGNMNLIAIQSELCQLVDDGRNGFFAPVIYVEAKELTAPFASKHAHSVFPLLMIQKHKVRLFRIIVILPLRYEDAPFRKTEDIPLPVCHIQICQSLHMLITRSRTIQSDHLPFTLSHNPIKVSTGGLYVYIYYIE